MSIIFLLSIFFICYIPTLVLMAVMPYISRKTENFGISIPEEAYNSAELKAIRDEYRLHVILFGGVYTLAVLGTTLAIPMDIAIIFVATGVFIQLAISFLLYLRGHHKVKALKAQKQWQTEKHTACVIDTNFRARKIQVSPSWFFLYALVIFSTVGIGLLMYDSLPDKMPMDWNGRGEVDRWAAKSYKTLFIAPILQLFIASLMAFVYWVIGTAKQNIDTANPEKSIEQNRVFRYRWSAFTVFMGLGLLLVFGFMQIGILGLVTNPFVIMSFPIGFTFIAIIGSIILSITTGQGGSKVNTIMGNSGSLFNRDEDKHWKLGMFYYNSDDPALFVEKRFGIGWTNNFARPASWFMMMGLFVFIFGIIAVINVLAK